MIFVRDNTNSGLAVARRIERDSPTRNQRFHLLLLVEDHKYVACNATTKNLHLSECRQSLTSTRLCNRPPFPIRSTSQNPVHPRSDYQFFHFPFLRGNAKLFEPINFPDVIESFVEINRIKIMTNNIRSNNIRDKYKFADKSWYRSYSLITMYVKKRKKEEEKKKERGGGNRLRSV